VIALAACAHPSSPPHDAAAARGEARAAAVDEAALDRRVSPCDDFYAFACGGWMERTQIPDDDALYRRSFDAIADEDARVLRTILERAAEEGGERDDLHKAGAFYASCMDEKSVDANGERDVAELLAIADGVSDAPSVGDAIGRLHAAGIYAVFELSARRDVANASRAELSLSPAELGLVDVETYAANDARSVALRAAYEAHVAAMFGLAGEAPVKARGSASAVLAIETALAHAESGPGALPERGDATTLGAVAPDFAWARYLAGVGGPSDVAFEITRPELFAALDDLMKVMPIAAWRAYVRWSVLRAAAPAMGARFAEEDLALQRVLYGVRALAPRWKTCARAVEAAMGDAVGPAFVAAAGTDDAHRAADAVVAHVEAAMHESIARATFMDEATRARAIARLARLANRIGYPIAWRSYEDLGVVRGHHTANVLRARALAARRALAEASIAQGDRAWPIAVSSIDARYDPFENEIVVPSGLLRAPMYASDAPSAAAFGALGMVVGHELTHAVFDASALGARATCVARQFDAYVAIDDVHVRGALTLAEDVADLGGVALAYRAFERAPADDARDSFTREQQFFIAFAQTWCAKARPEAMRLRATTNPHAPARFRVNGPLSDFAPFATAFACPRGSAMTRAPEDRCDVW
jgi:predicted metalloendopeptidase